MYNFRNIKKMYFDDHKYKNYNQILPYIRSFNVMLEIKIFLGVHKNTLVLI